MVGRTQSSESSMAYGNWDVGGGYMPWEHSQLLQRAWHISATYSLAVAQAIQGLCWIRTKVFSFRSGCSILCPLRK